MKILMVTSSYPLFEGDGTAPFIEEIARSVAARGHQVDVVLPAHPKFERIDEPRLRFFPFPYAPVPGLGVWGYAQSMDADRGFKMEDAPGGAVRRPRHHERGPAAARVRCPTTWFTPTGWCRAACCRAQARGRGAESRWSFHFTAATCSRRSETPWWEVAAAPRLQAAQRGDRLQFRSSRSCHRSRRAGRKHAHRALRRRRRISSARASRSPTNSERPCVVASGVSLDRRPSWSRWAGWSRRRASPI